MIPLLTTDQMREADARAVARRGTEALVEAAGTAVALEAKRMLGTCYGARVAVIVGPGLNGADGQVAAAWLGRRGAQVRVVMVTEQPTLLDGYDLVVDAAFGVGCSRPYRAPGVPPHTLVLAVDLPSGVDADTGALLGSPLRADVTIAIGALKRAHVDGPALSFVGELRFASLGIVEDFVDGVVEDRDLDTMIEFESNDHKWVHAIQVFAGSPMMPGAGELALRGALAGGASMVRLTSRGPISALVRVPPEVVLTDEGPLDQRCRAIVAGPGLGADAPTWLRPLLRDTQVPVVLDADGLDRLLLPTPPRPGAPWVLTPHAGEFARLTGVTLESNRLDAVQSLARETGCVVLLKGPTTIVAHPDGRLRIVRSGTTALATAGSGDVLSGLIGATIARGHEPFEASALAAHLHGLASASLAPYATASQLPREVARILAQLANNASPRP